MDDTDKEESHELMELMEQLDQKIIFKKAFDYGKSRTNKDVVTIGDMLHYFVNKNTSSNDKITLGWTAISMINERQDSMNMSDEDKKLLVNKIIKDMFE